MSGFDIIKGDGVYAASILSKDLMGNGRYNIKVHATAVDNGTRVITSSTGPASRALDVLESGNLWEHSPWVIPINRPSLFICLSRWVIMGILLVRRLLYYIFLFPFPLLHFLCFLFFFFLFYFLCFFFFFFFFFFFDVVVLLLLSSYLFISYCFLDLLSVWALWLWQRLIC